MKLLLFATAILAIAAKAESLLTRNANDIRLESRYPIGNGKGSNVKVSGRLFDIDGRVGYFAGMDFVSPPISSY